MMRKIFRYILLSVGYVLGTVVGMWVVRMYLEQKLDQTPYTTTHFGKVITERASRIAEEVLVDVSEPEIGEYAHLSGDSTTDAPPPPPKKD